MSTVLGQAFMCHMVKSTPASLRTVACDARPLEHYGETIFITRLASILFARSCFILLKIATCPRPSHPPTVSGTSKLTVTGAASIRTVGQEQEEGTLLFCHQLRFWLRYNQNGTHVPGTIFVAVVYRKSFSVLINRFAKLFEICSKSLFHKETRITIN